MVSLHGVALLDDETMVAVRVWLPLYEIHEYNTPRTRPRQNLLVAGSSGTPTLGANIRAWKLCAGSIGSAQ